MSLDGFVAGAGQSLQEPLGIGGEQLHEWVFPREAWRRTHGKAYAASGKDVALAGGARTAQQYLSAGLVDEMQLHVVPTLLGGGERLFDGVADLQGLVLVETVAAPNVVHLKFARQ